MYAREMLTHSDEIIADIGSGIEQALVVHFAGNDCVPRRLLLQRYKADEVSRFVHNCRW